MKQVLQNIRNGRTTVVDVPVPFIKPGMILVRTETSVVSAGTERMVVEFAEKSLLNKARSRPDLVQQVVDKAKREGLLATVGAAFNRLDQPLVLGYASAGKIVEIGDGITGFKVGERVACAGGGYAVHAEYALVPKNLVNTLPEWIDCEVGAFTTLGSIAMHGFRLSETGLGDRVAIIGLGLLGMLAAQIAQAAGCSVLGIDLDAWRIKIAQSIGIESIHRDLAEQSGLAFTKGAGFDAVIICADTPSSDPVILAGDIARDRAKVVTIGAVGEEIPRKLYYEKELVFINSRSYGPGRYDASYEQDGKDYPIGYVRWTEGRNMAAFIELLERGRIDVKSLITHRYPIEQANEAYQLITGKKDEPFLGVVLTYPTDTPVREDIKTIYQAQPKGVRSTTIEKEMPPGKVQIKLGVLGAGNYANAVFLPMLKSVPNINLIGIASGSGSNAQQAAQKYHFKYATSDENRIFSDETINTVAILTRHHLHTSQLLTGLKANKNVFCEKPLAITADELTKVKVYLKDSMTEEDRAGNRKPLFTIGFNRRFAPMVKQMADFLSGRVEPIVAIYRVNAGFLPATHWVQDLTQGGGRIIGEVCHFIDVFTYLVGSLPVSVEGNSISDSGRYSQDNVVLNYHFPDGSLATILYLANGDQSIPKERIEVFCEGKVAILDDFRRLELVRGKFRKVYRNRLRQDKGHRALWQAFCKAIQGGVEPPIPYHQIIGVTQASFAAVEVVKQGKRIDIP